MSRSRLVDPGPHSQLLDREYFRSQVQTALMPQVDLLKELVDYGTHLIIRCLDPKENNRFTSLATLTILLKHCVTMLDAVHACLLEGQLAGMRTCTRSLWEARLYSTYIFLKDPEERARAYYVWHLRRKREKVLRVAEGRIGSSTFEKELRQIGMKISRNELKATRAQARAEGKRIAKVLSAPGHVAINGKFDKLETKKNGTLRASKWYEPFGCSSIRQVACEVGLQVEYDWIYGDYSQTTHAHDVGAHIHVTDGAIGLEPIRSLQGSDQVLSFTITTTTALYRSVLDFFRPDELPAYGKKYVTEWRQRANNIRKIVYRHTT